MKALGRLAYLTSEEMGEVDRMAIEGFGIDVMSLMENAGARTAEIARRMLGGRVEGKKICCLVGKGNNGGDGLVAARHLQNWGCDARVAIGGEKGELREVPGKQLATIEKMGVQITGPGDNFEGFDLLIDALLGYGSRGNPREPLAGLIRKANRSGSPTLAVDIPSGLDATTGVPGDPCIAASATVTFGFPKMGFLNPGAKAQVGELYLADISLPKGIYERFRMWGAFGEESIVAIK